MNPGALAGMRVLEFGSRIGVGACGRLLADLGATVFIVEPRHTRQQRDDDATSVSGGSSKWIDRSLATAAKHSVLFDSAREADIDELAALAACCDVVLLSTDVDGADVRVQQALKHCPIFCDITAFGATGPMAGKPASEFDVQALTGVMDTTGFPDGAAMPIGLPVIEMSSGIYAAAATAIAWRVLRRDGVGQRIDVALFDTAINALTTFLPAHFAGKASRRLGNGHSMAVPWNAYESKTGWILICSANDAQWRKLAALISPGLVGNPDYATLEDRLARRAEVDGHVARWVAGLEVDPLVDLLLGAGIPCGAIVTIDQLHAEPNLALRQSIAEVNEPGTGRAVRVPTSLVHVDDDAVVVPAIPPPDSGRAAAHALAPRPRRERSAVESIRAPFDGLRVIEIGQFTTAPLAARHLASFGADVIKIEPAEGDSARAWAPHRNNTSHFFIISNGEKRSLALDLRSDGGRAAFANLVAGADVLVENMKPGSLRRLGFDRDRLRALNPRLVYCAISGFGLKSAYDGRPAFDTVVQAMCGIMDATRLSGVPVKSGISAADIGGGQVGLLAIVAALERRKVTGQGAMIDIAMQDVGAWLTQLRWNVSDVSDVSARDTAYKGPVASVADASQHAQTVARELLVVRRDAVGTDWEMLASPMRLSRTPPGVGTPLGAASTALIGWRTR